MNTEVSSTAEDTELEKFMALLSSLSPVKMAIWNNFDHRKTKEPFFPVHAIAKEKIIFVIKNRAMIGFFRSTTERKFYMRFYWLASQCPGYISSGLSYEEASVILREFVEDKLNMNKAKAEALKLKPIVGQCDTYLENDMIHKQVMEKIFLVNDFDVYIDSSVDQ